MGRKGGLLPAGGACAGVFGRVRVFSGVPRDMEWIRSGIWRCKGFGCIWNRMWNGIWYGVDIGLDVFLQTRHKRGG